MTSVPRIAPLSIADGNRRRFPWRDNSRSSRVPLWTASVAGEEIEGRIVIPSRLANTVQHSNERLEFDRIIRENLHRWVEWRKQRGWEIATVPKVRGPFDPPQSSRAKSKAFFERAKSVIGTASHAREVTDFDEAEEAVWYMVTARFTRSTPVYARLDDMLFFHDLAKTYEIDAERDTTPWLKLPRGKAVIDDDSPPVDPLAFAEAGRQKRGLRRKDYLLGKLSEPL